MEKSLVEALPQNIEIGFQLKNVVKEFQVKKEKKRAVDDLTFTAVANEITVLLGHNGAGKSTTMNMLTGMLSADSGDCYVGGINVAKDLNKARKTVGLCPQHNILIKEMTVKEHFLFFAQLKGFTKEQAEKEQPILTGEVQLEDKTDVQANALSGGMKRKLRPVFELFFLLQTTLNSFYDNYIVNHSKSWYRCLWWKQTFDSR